MSTAYREKVFRTSSQRIRESLQFGDTCPQRIGIRCSGCLHSVSEKVFSLAIRFHSELENALGLVTRLHNILEKVLSLASRKKSVEFGDMSPQRIGKEIAFSLVKGVHNISGEKLFDLATGLQSVQDKVFDFTHVSRTKEGGSVPYGATCVHSVS